MTCPIEENSTISFFLSVILKSVINCIYHSNANAVFFYVGPYLLNSNNVETHLFVPKMTVHMSHWVSSSGTVVAPARPSLGTRTNAPASIPSSDPTHPHSLPHTVHAIKP